MCFLNTEKVPLGECCAISETSEMFTFLMALTMPNYDSNESCFVYSALTYERIVNMFRNRGCHAGRIICRLAIRNDSSAILTE